MMRLLIGETALTSHRAASYEVNDRLVGSQPDGNPGEVFVHDAIVTANPIRGNGRSAAFGEAREKVSRLQGKVVRVSVL